MHWNSEPHIRRESGVAEVEEEKKEEQVAETSAAAGGQQEPEIEPTYETEKLYGSLNQFKMSMGLFTDSYKLRLASNTSGL